MKTSEHTRIVNPKVGKEKLKQVIDGGLVNLQTIDILWPI